MRLAAQVEQVRHPPLLAFRHPMNGLLLRPFFHFFKKLFLHIFDAVPSRPHRSSPSFAPTREGDWLSKGGSAAISRCCHRFFFSVFRFSICAPAPCFAGGELEWGLGRTAMLERGEGIQASSCTQRNLRVSATFFHCHRPSVDGGRRVCPPLGAGRWRRKVVLGTWQGAMRKNIGVFRHRGGLTTPKFQGGHCLNAPPMGAFGQNGGFGKLGRHLRIRRRQAARRPPSREGKCSFPGETDSKQKQPQSNYSNLNRFISFGWAWPTSGTCSGRLPRGESREGRGTDVTRETGTRNRRLSDEQNDFENCQSETELQS